MIREAIAKVVEGQDLTADEAAQVMGEIMERRGHARPARGLPDGAARQGRDAGRNHRHGGRDAEQGARRRGRGPAGRHLRYGRRRVPHLQHIHHGRARRRGRGREGRQARQPRGIRIHGQRGRARGAGGEHRAGAGGRRAVHRRGRVRVHVRPDLPPGDAIRRRAEARDRHPDHLQHAWAADEPRWSEGRRSSAWPTRAWRRRWPGSSTPRASPTRCWCTGRTGLTRSASPRRRTSGT